MTGDIRRRGTWPVFDPRPVEERADEYAEKLTSGCELSDDASASDDCLVFRLRLLAGLRRRGLWLDRMPGGYRVRAVASS